MFEAEILRAGVKAWGHRPANGNSGSIDVFLRVGMCLVVPGAACTCEDGRHHIAGGKLGHVFINRALLGSVAIGFGKQDSTVCLVQPTQKMGPAVLKWRGFPSVKAAPRVGLPLPCQNCKNCAVKTALPATACFP